MAATTVAIADRSVGEFLPAPGPCPRDRAEVLEAARRALDVARPRERRALELVGQGFNASDAARDAGVSRQTVSNWLARLREELAPAFGEDPRVGKHAEPADEVRARAFVLQDAKGRTRATLEVAGSGTVGLRVFDSSGRVRLEAGIQGDDPGLALLDERGRTRVAVCLHDGAPELALRDEDGNPVPVAGPDPWLAREADELAEPRAPASRPA
jgi:transposase-like protein